MARGDDGLLADIEHLPEPLPDHCTVERVGPQLSAWRTALLGLLKRGSLRGTAWKPPAGGVTSSRPGEQRRYVDLVHGQVGIRIQGQRGGSPPVLLLPDVPGGAASMRRLAASLAGERMTVSPELPGLGESHPLPYPTLGSFTTVLHEVLEGLHVPVVDIVAEGLGCCFAAALAAHQPKHVRRLALDGVPMIRSRDRRRVARHYCPAIEPDRYGAYLQRLWHQRRDAETCWPWFDRSEDGARMRDAELDARAMHEDFVAAVHHLSGYGDAARAALESSLRDILPAVRQPALLFDLPGDVRYAGVPRAARRLPSGELKPRPSDPEVRAACLREFLA